MLKANFAEVGKFFKLVKFSHTIFALPFALIGFFLAIKLSSNDFSWRLFGLILLAMVFARNSAMGFNRYLDRDIDAKKPKNIFPGNTCRTPLSDGCEILRYC